MSKNILFEELEKVVNQELLGGGGLKPWTPKIAESFHTAPVKTLIEDEYFLNLKGLLYPFWVDFIEELEAERKRRRIDLVVIEAGIGSGKAQPLDAIIMTPDGYKFMGGIEIGDLVLTDTGSPSTVTGVFNQGEKDIYKVEFSDGSSTECCKEHLWFTCDRRERVLPRKRVYNREVIGSVKSTEEIMNSLYINRGKYVELTNHSIPVCQPVQFNNDYKFIIHPYLMGALLGDGCFRGGGSGVTFTNEDEEIISNCKNLIPNSCKWVSYPASNYYGIVSKIKKHHTKSDVSQELINLGLMGVKSRDKFIPQQYLISSVEDRISLLQGLMDTDGSVSKISGSLYYYTVSERLKDDVRFLVESLGGVVKVRNKIPKYIYNGEERTGQKCYVLCISLNSNVAPFRLSRKKNLVKAKTKYPPSRFIKNITYVGKKPSRCIAIDSNSHLYLTNNFIVTHNTYVTSALLWIEWFRFTTTPNPREAFPFIDPDSTKAFILMSRTADQAKKVVFTNVYPRFQCKFNMEYFPPDPKVKASLNIPRNKTLIFPGTGEAASALGYNMFSSIVDEANFLENVATGSSSAEKEDQAEAMWDQISSRVSSRFGYAGAGGLVFFISSANRTKSWMEKKMLDALKHGDERDKIFWKRIPVWKSKPASFFPSGQKFLFNPNTFEIVTDHDMIQEFYSARDRLQLSSPVNKYLGGLLI